MKSEFSFRMESIKFLTYHGTIEMYEYYQIMICLLKLDFFVFVGVTMQVSFDHEFGWHV